MRLLAVQSFYSVLSLILLVLLWLSYRKDVKYVYQIHLIITLRNLLPLFDLDGVSFKSAQDNQFILLCQFLACMMNSFVMMMFF
mmetsp:Transcript_17625/g.29767  ORF Transcript_17625/g.29767 Transcript_17625/m.29767 type:complete len:84 (-) Transcript_17625:581-832(-)